MAVKTPLFFMFLFCLLGLQLSLECAQNTKIKAIVFDFGGVIAKTDKQIVAEYIASSFNISQAEALEAIAGLKENSLDDGQESDYWMVYSRSKNKKLQNDWLQKLNDTRLNAMREIPGMVDIVKNLKEQGYQTALLSNVRKSQAQIKRKLGLYELFHPAILSYESGIRKPDPKAYKLILNKLNLCPEEVIFIDNKPDNVAAAKALGIDAILFEDAAQLTSALKERGIEISTIKGR